MSTTTPPIDATRDETAIRPFGIDVPEGPLVDLRERIDATRWPRSELVADRSQGVQLPMIQELARYWATEHDWRACEAKLNALPQFTTPPGRRRSDTRCSIRPSPSLPGC